MDVQAQPGFVVWITGMNGSGKTALARVLQQRFAAAGRPAELLDADDPAAPLTLGADWSREARDAAMRRVGFVAKTLARNGVVAVCAALSPQRDQRDALRREVRRFVEVFVDCPMEVLLQRDPIYRKAMAGEVKQVPGVDDPYEPPTRPDLTVRSDQETPEAAAARLFQTLVDLKYVGPAEFGRLTGGARPKRAKPAKAKKAARSRPPAGKRREASGRPARKLATRSAMRQPQKKLARRPQPKVRRRR
jgi:adenylyl-sulfate kinase